MALTKTRIEVSNADVAPRPYTREEYEHLHDWMTSWELLDPDSSYDRIVSVKTTATA